MKYKWAQVIGLLAILALTAVPAYAQGPLPDWILEYMRGHPGAILRLTAQGYMVSYPGSFGEWLLSEAANAAMEVGADPARGVSLVRPGSVGVAFYQPLPPQEAVQGSVQAIQQQSNGTTYNFDWQPHRWVGESIAYEAQDRARQIAQTTSRLIAAGAAAAGATESSIFALVANLSDQSSVLWRIMHPNLVGPVVN